MTARWALVRRVINMNTSTLLTRVGTAIANSGLKELVNVQGELSVFLVQSVNTQEN